MGRKPEHPEGTPEAQGELHMHTEEAGIEPTTTQLCAKMLQTTFKYKLNLLVNYGTKPKQYIFLTFIL